MAMPGVTFKEIQTALLAAYKEPELAEVLRFEMNERLDVIIAPGTFKHRVFELIEWAEMHGREVELVQVTSRARPGHLGMQQIYKKYGMAVPVFVQKTGAAVAGAPTDAADGGLEGLVRPHSTFVDLGVWRERLARVETQVCRITVNGLAAGTGFLVGPEAVLTNYHVLQRLVANQVAPTAVQCQFDYKLLADNVTRTQTNVGLHPTRWYIDHSEYTQAEADREPDRDVPPADRLDYALVRLARPFGDEPAVPHPEPGRAQPRGWVRVPDKGKALAFKSPMPLVIAQHPDGAPLKMAMDTSAIDKTLQPPLWLNGAGTRVRYATRTEGGSSGSPCFDFDWNLIALHHYGDPAQGHPPTYNQGVPIGLIRDLLESRGHAADLGGDPP